MIQKRLYADYDTKNQLELIGLENNIELQNDMLLFVIKEYRERRKPHCIMKGCSETNPQSLNKLNEVDQICSDCSIVNGISKMGSS